MVSNKLNAAGMAPEHSMVLPEREASQEEQMILAALVELYASPNPNEAQALSVFAPDVIYSSPRGDVFVGHQGLSKLLASRSSARKVQHRLLATPETLPANTMVVDQIVAAAPSTAQSFGEAASAMGGEETSTKRSLLVLKRREDGMVSSLTEEEGHRRATAPLAARAASASNFYSPTDSMVSPCTSKLNLAKRKHHNKAKPMNLFASHVASANSRTAPTSSAAMNF